MKRLLAITTALALAGCASMGSGAKKDEKQEKVALANIYPFDVAACGARPLDLSNPTPEVVFGAVLSMDPAFQECFLDPKALDGAELKDNALRTTVGATVTIEVLGTGITQSGKDCLVAAARKLPFKTLDAAAKPVTADVPVGPAFKPVIFGLNNGSDATGTIRLAQSTSFCACYAEIGTQPAPTLEAKLVLSKTKPAEVTMTEPAQETTLSKCVLEKIKPLTFPAADLTLPYRFLLKNSYATDVTPGAQAALQFQQYEAIRAQRTADVLLASGKHTTAANVYGALVEKYKANPRANIGLIGELRKKCAEVLVADDGQLAALKNLLAVVDSASKLVQAEKVKNPEWASTEEALAKQQANYGAELTRVESQRKFDESSCPKSK